MEAEERQLVYDLEAFFPSAFPPTVANVVRSSRGEMELTVADMERMRDTPSSRTLGPGTISQTIAIYSSREARFPYFTLHPKEFGTRMLPETITSPVIDISAASAFRHKFLLRADREDVTRALFTPDVLYHIGRTSGLCVLGQARSLLVCSGRLIKDAAERQAFLDSAAEIFALLENSGRLLQASTPARGKGPGAQPTSIGGRVLATLDQIEVWAAKPPPRPLFMALWQYLDASAPFMGLAVCLAFALGGALFFKMFGLDDSGRLLPWTSLAMAIFPAMMALGGLAGFAAMALKIVRLIGVLRRGTLLEATIDEIHDTGTAWGDSTSRVLKLSFRTPNGPVKATSTLTRRGLTRATGLFAAKRPAKILVHPSNSSRVIFIGNLPEASPDFD